MFTSFIISCALHFTLCVNAPETLLPPQQIDFINENYYKKAEEKFKRCGNWASDESLYECIK